MFDFTDTDSTAAAQSPSPDPDSSSLTHSAQHVNSIRYFLRHGVKKCLSEICGTIEMAEMWMDENKSFLQMLSSVFFTSSFAIVGIHCSPHYLPFLCKKSASPFLIITESDSSLHSPASSVDKSNITSVDLWSFWV